MAALLALLELPRSATQHDAVGKSHEASAAVGDEPVPAEALLDAEDVVYMKALEADDADAKAASVTKKTNLRDAPAASAITNAADIAALKAAWDADLLGDSPYA